MRMALAVLASVLLSAPARADTHPTTAVSWVTLPGAEGCGSATAFARDVERRLGRPEIASLAAGDISIEVRIERAGDPPLWHATVEQHDARGALLGTREIENGAPECGELRESVVLIVALMIDPDAVAAVRTAAMAALAATPPKPAVARRVEEGARPIVRERPDSWRASAGAGMAVGYGLLPFASAGVVASVEVEPPNFWSFEGYGAVWTPQNIASPGLQADSRYPSRAPLRCSVAWPSTCPCFPGDSSTTQPAVGKRRPSARRPSRPRRIWA